MGPVRGPRASNPRPTSHETSCRPLEARGGQLSPPGRPPRATRCAGGPALLWLAQMPGSDRGAALLAAGAHQRGNPPARRRCPGAPPRAAAPAVRPSKADQADAPGQELRPAQGCVRRSGGGKGRGGGAPCRRQPPQGFPAVRTFLRYPPGTCTPLCPSGPFKAPPALPCPAHACTHPSRSVQRAAACAGAPGRAARPPRSPRMPYPLCRRAVPFCTHPSTCLSPAATRLTCQRCAGRRDVNCDHLFLFVLPLLTPGCPWGSHPPAPSAHPARVPHLRPHPMLAWGRLGQPTIMPF